MTFYTGLQSTAASLLTSYGRSLTFTRTTPGAYNPATGTTGAGTATEYTGYGAVLEYRNREVDGERILQGDRKIILQNVSTEPNINDVVPIDSESYTVLGVMSLNPAGTNVIYTLHVRL